MHQTVLVSGIACLIAAIVGGGLKAFKIEIPVVNSPVRQTILGGVGLAMIGIGLLRPFSVHPDASSANDGSMSSPAEEKSRVLVVRCTVDPAAVSARTSARVRVRVMTEEGTPVSDARVRIQSDGGQFSGSESAAAVGRTNGEGVFTAEWRTPSSPRTGYKFDVGATKEGYEGGEGGCRVSTSTPGPPTGGRISVECTVEPHAIGGGERAAIRILALTEEDNPVQEARVKLSSGGGWFAESGTTTEVGRTGENGVFETQWRAPDPAAQAYVMSVRVSKEGFSEGEGKCRVPIE